MGTRTSGVDLSVLTVAPQLRSSDRVTVADHPDPFTKEDMVSSPENKEAPNKSETYPSKDRSKTERALGRIAINGATKPK